jgi:shikimate dehydrogenase
MGRTGINGAYVPFMVDSGNLGRAMEGLRVLNNFAGANITAPFKEKVMPYLDIVSESANIIGSVNTIVCKGGQLKGYNTDAVGIMDALGAKKYDVAGKRALVIGTGGSARAVVFILNWLRADAVIVAGRDDQKTNCLAEHFSCEPRSFNDLMDKPLNVDLIVNAASVAGREASADLTAVAGGIQGSRCRLVFDLNYGRRENIWKNLAQRCNIPFMDGLSRLAFQARRTFLLWTGQKLPQEEFIRAISAPDSNG